MISKPAQVQDATGGCMQPSNWRVVEVYYAIVKLTLWLCSVSSHPYCKIFLEI
jgi:hypothetical protein